MTKIELQVVDSRIIKFAQPFMEGHHDLAHYKRVLRFADLIWQKEGGDWEIISAAIWMHDIGRKRSIPNHPRIGAELAKKFLPTIGFPVEKIEPVAQAILVHDDHGAQKTNEEKIVYDADRLDCFSYTGLIRCFLEPAKTGRSMINRGQKVVGMLGIIKDAEDYLEIAFQSLNTETARSIALNYRAEYLDNFLANIKNEQ